MKNIQELLENKSFEALTEQERNSVLSVVSMSEYKEMYAVLQQSKTAFNQVNARPNPLIKQNLNNQFREKNRSGISLLSWLMIPIPLWMILLSLGILGSLFYYFNANQKTPVPIIQKEIEQVFVYKTDTIYLEKIIPTPKIKKKTRSETKKVLPKKETLRTNPPIAESSIDPSFLMEQALTYYDSSAIQRAQEQSLGQKARTDIPKIEVTVR